MDKIERIGHLCLEAIAKARELNTRRLDRDLKLRIAAIMKTVRGTAKRIQALTDAASENGIMDKATTERALDRIIKSLEDANRELDLLLAKAQR
jgi:hypothetical protein